MRKRQYQNSIGNGIKNFIIAVVVINFIAPFIVGTGNVKLIRFTSKIFPLIVFAIIAFVSDNIFKNRKKNQATTSGSRVEQSSDEYYQTANDYSQQEFKQQEFAEHSYDDVHDYEEHSYSNDNSYEAYYQQEMKRAKEHKRQMSTKDKNGPFWIDD